MPKNDRSKYDQSKAEMLADIAMRMDWEEKRRTRVGMEEAQDIYRFIKGGKEPPEDWSLADHRRWLAEVSYIITHPEATWTPEDELARYDEYDQSPMTADHIKWLHETIEMVTRERVEAIEDALDEETTPEWYDG